MTDITPHNGAKPAQNAAPIAQTAAQTVNRQVLAQKVAHTVAVLEQAAQIGHVRLASSMSAEDVVLIALIAKHGLNISIFAIDTLMLHADTVAQIERVASHYGVAIDTLYPRDEDVAAYIKDHGKHAFYESLELRLACCHLRKVVPLEQALKGVDGWVTGQRREQAQSRADLAEVETDTVRNIAKFNPLAAWTWAEIAAFVADNDVPISPLYDRNYVTIGCDACTRAVRPGEDARAARWWWEDASAKECGLHIMPAKG